MESYIRHLLHHVFGFLQRESISLTSDLESWGYCLSERVVVIVIVVSPAPAPAIHEWISRLSKIIGNAVVSGEFVCQMSRGRTEVAVDIRLCPCSSGYGLLRRGPWSEE